jgi:hypothetical protein
VTAAIDAEAELIRGHRHFNKINEKREERHLELINGAKAFCRGAVGSALRIRGVDRETK